ncbi:MAG: phosphonate ABC transporter ATP-binding protein [Bdellovibrionales bacterium]|nr:phosphonate ABC transporter ATP-binding protein [Bdellovibrionales bacterium]
MSASGSPLLNVRSLGKTYPNGTKALSDVSFSVDAGEFLVVIGLSGSGKTTLLRCLNRLVDPSYGEIDFAGRRIETLQGAEVRSVRQDMAMIFQQFNLVPRLSALTNVLTGQLAHQPTWKSLLGLHSSTEREAALEFLKLVGIADKARVRCDQLSGGQQQRVAIARALYQKPKLLLADEPVASLDPATSHSVMDYLRKANRELGITVICNLHYLSLVREYATRVIALKEGRLVFEGRPEEIDRAWFQRIYGEEARDVGIQ